jgi:hypothetical protein
MQQPDLLVICIAAFVAVFSLLSLLAVVMRLLIAVYPEKVAGIDAAVLAAVSAAATSAFPGMRVTNIEEKP